MILHPGILALFLGTAAALFLVAAGLVVGIRVVSRWDINSSSESQLRLERQTHLATAAVKLALGFTVVSVFLFAYTADDLHRLVVGAMCATGTLNAAPGGWLVLGVKTMLLFLAAGWLLLNAVDEDCETMPLARMRYALLLLIAPLALADGIYQLRFFLAIHPDIITSCCGSLFTTGDDTVASTLSAFPPRQALAAFYGSFTFFLAAGALRLFRPSTGSATFFAAAAAVMFPVSLAAIVSVFSLYFYESPVHHCPFDILQGSHRYIGYPVYASLCGAVIFGLAVGVFQPLAGRPELSSSVTRRQRRWTVLSIVFMALFAALVSWPVLFGPFRLLAYG